MAGGGKLAMNIDYVKRVSGERRSLEQIKREPWRSLPETELRTPFSTLALSDPLSPPMH